jgi:tRNA nucleotidyltransferase (CCA-adding enzyme)
MEFYEVGGCVRDELLGVKSKDIDFTVVLEPVAGDPFRAMVNRLKMMGFEVFLESPEFLTVRAKFPKTGSLSARPERGGMTADFVLARKESDYTDGRRPDKVEPGTLMDDLKRRDFTMNAIAKDKDGNLIDPFNGVQDIERRIIRAVGDPNERFTEDALRIVRALRFSVTKGFDIDHETEDAMWRLRHTVAGVSAERVREELTKMFNADPMKTIQVLREMDILPIIFGMGINFQPTMKQKVR